MLTIEEVKKYADMLDREYENEVKPILNKAHEAIDRVLAPVLSKDWKIKAKRIGATEKAFGLNCAACGNPDIVSVLNSFKYFDLFGEIHTYGVPTSIVTWLGYSATCSSLTDLYSVFLRGDRYRGEDGILCMIETIKELKTRFNDIKRDYEFFFTDNNAAVFKRFVTNVKQAYDYVVEKESELDDELRSLFGKDKPVKKLRIDITISEC